MSKPVMKRLAFYLGLVTLPVLCGWGDDSGGQLVRIGERRLFSRCSGPASAMSVVLVNGLGASLDMWRAVQADLESQFRVCSYDRAGEGRSDKPTHLQTPDEIVRDLNMLLHAEKLAKPYILVGASLGGIYVRRFAEQYPGSTVGIVLVDSAHEEQYGRYAAISRPLAERYATQDGRFDRNEFLQFAGQLEPPQRLQWHLDVPLVVLEHKRGTGAAQTEADRMATVWHELQVDLAARSKFGNLVETHSGHAMATEEPAVVVKSIQDVARQAESRVSSTGGR